MKDLLLSKGIILQSGEISKDKINLVTGASCSKSLSCFPLGYGFAAAFASAAPSIHPVDLLVGVAGAVLIRLIVYVKGKNAKKYRKGVESGSARWGNAEDIKP